MATRSECVARAQLIAGFAGPVYTVPAGSSFILKSLVVSQATGTGAYVLVYLVAPSPLLGVQLAKLDAAAAGGQVLEHWLVMRAGDYLQLNVTGTDCQFWLSGALLPEA